MTLEIHSSLYEAALAAGEDPSIGVVLADVFAWDIDFYEIPRKGDKARALVEKFVSKGRVLRYGEVLAAAYEGGLVGTKRVFRFQPPDGQANYFQEDGSSARKTFLKSPLKYAHVTSGFGSRFHPVLQYLKAHNGVDYGTPIGTPVWAVADGTVTKAQNTGPGGNTVCVRHINGLETCYLHLSKYGAGVRVGSRVSQKQVIAYSGNTGRSTGPHLHFALKRGGPVRQPAQPEVPPRRAPAQDAAAGLPRPDEGAGLAAGLRVRGGSAAGKLRERRTPPPRPERATSTSHSSTNSRVVQPWTVLVTFPWTPETSSAAAQRALVEEAGCTSPRKTRRSFRTPTTSHSWVP